MSLQACQFKEISTRDSVPLVIQASELSKNSSSFSQNSSFIDLTVPGNRLFQKENGEIVLIPKTPAEVIGERVLRPLIDGIYLWTSRCFSKLPNTSSFSISFRNVHWPLSKIAKVMFAIDELFTCSIQFIPIASAQPQQESGKLEFYKKNEHRELALPEENELENVGARSVNVFLNTRDESTSCQKSARPIHYLALLNQALLNFLNNFFLTKQEALLNQALNNFFLDNKRALLNWANSFLGKYIQPDSFSLDRSPFFDQMQRVFNADPMEQFREKTTQILEEMRNVSFTNLSEMMELETRLCTIS